MTTRALVTGVGGFVGAHVVEYLLEKTDWEVVALIRQGERLPGTRVRYVSHDLSTPFDSEDAKRLGRIDTILHFAARTYVDSSITNPMPFVMDNVVGTANLLNYARTFCRDTLNQFLMFSTDEVFGPAPPGVSYKEWDRYRSSSPYSASKAGAEELCVAFERTYGLNIYITHCMNIFGERQRSEKFIPKVIRCALLGETMPIYYDFKADSSGSRTWMHAKVAAEGVLFVLRHGQSGEKYNIVGDREVENLHLATHIADLVGKPLKYDLIDVGRTRPGHDSRYALDGTRMAEMGWSPSRTFEESLRATVAWFMENPQWLGIPEVVG